MRPLFYSPAKAIVSRWEAEQASVLPPCVGQGKKIDGLSLAIRTYIFPVYYVSLSLNPLYVLYNSLLLLSI